MRGYFFSFEGIDGSGKSEHSELLEQDLRSQCYPVVRTIEPGGTQIGDKIRRILKDHHYRGEKDPFDEMIKDPDFQKTICQVAAIFLYEAVGLQFEAEITPEDDLNKILAHSSKRIGKHIRGKTKPVLARLLADDLTVYNETLNPITELLLFEAARAQSYYEIVSRNIEDNVIVISDRSFDSSTAYQGYGRGLSLRVINYLNKLACQGVKPNLSFFIDADPEHVRAIYAKCGKGDRFEREDPEFMEKNRQGYLNIAEQEPKRVRVVSYIPDGIEQMFEEIQRHVYDLINKKVGGSRQMVLRF
jgi:dTMP kinase